MELAIDLAILVLAALIGASLLFMRTAISAAAKSGVETAVKQVDWPNELAREMEKVRGTERNQIRFESYGGLWAAMRPVAVYDTDSFGPIDAKSLSLALTNWYYSEKGGLLLTERARIAFFALQDLLKHIAELKWEAFRTVSRGDSEDRFKKISDQEGYEELARSIDAIRQIDYQKPDSFALDPKAWRRAVGQLADDWGNFDDWDRFVIIQQVSSFLRTILVVDVESRLN